MLDVYSLLKFLLICIIALLLSYLCGHVIISFFRSEEDSNKNYIAFSKFLSGMLFASLLSAIVATSGKTIALACLPFFAGILIAHKPSLASFKSNVGKIELQPLVYTLILGAISFFLCLFGYVYNFQHDALNINPDYNSYAQISSFISKYGIEARDYDFISPNKVSSQPYHYGLIWSNIFTSKLGGLNHSLALYLVTLPALLSIVISGATAMINELVKGNNFLKYLGILLLIFAPLTFYSTGITSYADGSMDHNITTQPKVVLVYALFIISLIHVFRKKFFIALNLLMIAAILYLVAMPAIAGAVGITALLSLWKKLISKKEFIAIVLSTLLMGVYLLLFYKFSAAGNDPLPTSEESVMAYHLSNNFRGFAGAVLRFAINFLIKVVPFIILAYLLFKKQLKSSTSFFIIILTSSMVVVASLVHGLFMLNVDADQFITRSVVPLITVLCFGLTITLLTKAVPYKVIACIILILTCIPAINPMFAYWGKGFYVDNKIIKHLDPRDDKELSGKITIATLNDNSFYKYIFKENIRTFTALGYLQFYTDTFSSTPIDMAEPDTSIIQYPSVFYSRPFYKYVVEQKKNRRYKDLYTSQVSFIKDNRIQFLAWTEKAQVSKELQKLIDSSTIIQSHVVDHTGNEYYLARLRVK